MGNDEAVSKLAELYRELRATERKDTVLRVAKIVTGVSVVRVFEKGTARSLVAALITLDLQRFGNCKTQEQFDEFYFSSLDKIDDAIDKSKPRNIKLGQGRKWGHAAKVLSLFLRDLVLYSRYFGDAEAARLQKFLYMPIDSVVFKHLHECGAAIQLVRIKDIKSKQSFLEIQDLLAQACQHANAPRILFDNVWSQDR